MADTDLLRPMTTQEIIGGTFRMYGSHLAVLVIVALFPHLGFLVAYSIFEQLTADLITLNLLTMFSTVLMNAVALGAITIAVALATAQTAPTVGVVYRLLARRNLMSLVVAYLITVLLTSFSFIPVIGLMLRGGGLIFAIPVMMIPGLVLGGLFTVTIPVIVLEGRSSLAAIGRSVRLVRKELPKAAAVFTFILLISGLLPMAFHLTVGLGPLSPLLNTILGSALLPLAYSANVLLYFSSRAAEGYSAEELTKAVLGE